MEFDLLDNGRGIRLGDVFVPGSDVTARLILSVIGQLPDDSAFVASLRGAPQDSPAEDTPLIKELRAKRRFRGWTTDRYLLARVGDLLAGKAYSGYPEDNDSPNGLGGRKVADLDDF